MIELKTYAGSNVTPQNDAIMNDTNTLNNGIYYGCNVTIKDATTLHINAGQGIVYGRLFEVLDSDIPVSLSPSGTLLGQLYVHIDLSNIAAPIQILVDTGETLADLEDDPQLNIDSGITDMQLATFTVSTVGMSDLVETFAEVEPIRAVLGDADISAIGDGSVNGAIRTLNTQLSNKVNKSTYVLTSLDKVSFGWNSGAIVITFQVNINTLLRLQMENTSIKYFVSADGGSTWSQYWSK